MTVDDQVPLLNDLIDKSLKGIEYSRATVTVLALPTAGKRKQIARGLEHSKGSITVLVDDDVFWQPLLLRYLLACFEDKEVGGVGTRQRAYLKPEEPRETLSIWHRLADRRLAGRNRGQSAMNYLDGGVTCLSGRTAAYRSEILKSPNFIQSFTQDLWLGRYPLDSGDDTFCTRWLVANRWKIKIQTASEAEIYTVVLNSPLFLKQVMRWARNTKRSFIRCLFSIIEIWRFVNHSFHAL